MLGSTISHYRVLRKLGGGGMGVVYEAEDLNLGRHVALKFLPEQFAPNAEALERFRREARAASALNHPNICTVYEIGEHEGKPFIAMQFLDGETLKQRIVPGVRWTPKRCWSWRFRSPTRSTPPTAKASSTATSSRPTSSSPTAARPRSWISVSPRWCSRSEMQLRWARRRRRQLAEEHLTSPGTAVGTVAYMSPEQVRGKELDARSDLFSFGVVLYEMATGVLPFRGETSGVISHAILERTPTAAHPTESRPAAQARRHH